MRQLVQDSLTYSTLTVASAVVGALAVLIYTRMLSPPGYGSYILAMGAVTVGAQVTGEWLGITPVQYLPQNRTEPAFWSSLAALTAGSIAAGTPLVLVLLVWAGKVSFIPAGLTLLTVLLVSKALGGVLRASGRVSAYTWISTAAVAAHLGLAAGLYWLTGRLESLLWGAAAASALTAAVLWAVQRDLIRLGAFLHWPTRTMLGRLAGFSVAIPLMGLGSQALQLCDRFLLAILRSDTEAGVYSANYALGEKATGLAFAPLMLAVYPLAVAKWARGNARAPSAPSSRRRRCTSLHAAESSRCWRIQGLRSAGGCLLIGSPDRRMSFSSSLSVPRYGASASCTPSDCTWSKRR